MAIHYAETTYGFDYGAAKVTRVCSDEKTGSVNIGIESPKGQLYVYVTKTGKIRVWLGGEELVSVSQMRREVRHNWV